MLSTEKIKKLFLRINQLLKEKGEKGEIGIVGGAVMCLVFQSRQATKDVDAVFEPTRLLRKLAAQVGEEEGIGPDWLNDGAKGFLQTGFQRNDVLNLSHLKVWAPDPRYMLAMKCISARWDSHDRDDVLFIIKLLEMKSAKEVLKLIEKFYPDDRVPTKTKFFLEEIFEKHI